MATSKLKVVSETEPPIDPRTTVFWYYSGKKCTINRERLYKASEHLGFRLYNNQLYQIIDQFLHERDPRFYYDALKKYIHDTHEESSQLETIYNAYETFIQKNGKFSIERLPIIHENQIVKDTKTICYKFYSNCYIKITAQSITELPYEKLPGYILATKVQPRKFINGNTGKYIEFLNLACEMQTNSEYVSKIVGYYAHEYNDEGMGYFIVLTEQVPDPKLGGGSGKNLFTNLFKQTTSVCDQSGSQTHFDDTIFQIWNGERIFSISDLPKDFDFTYFKNISTQGIIHKRLYKDRQAVSISISPKLIFNTNYSYVCTDGGLKRRIIPLEFTNFFTINGGVEGHFDCWFPNGWNEEDWAGYDGFVASSIQTWLKCGCKLNPKELSETGWFKQFQHTFGPTIMDIINEFWDRWCKKEFVDNKEFKQTLDDYYSDNNITQNYKPKIKTLHKALEEYGNRLDISFKADQARWENSITIKGRTFLKNNTALLNNIDIDNDENPF